jgi:L,D-transpeptidase catalytic domain
VDCARTARLVEPLEDAVTPTDRAQCRDVNRRGGLFIALIGVAAALAIPVASASAATGPPTLNLNGPKSPGLLDKVSAVGQLPGAVPSDQVTVTVQASGRTVEKKQIGVGADGKFSFPFVIDSCCNYEVTATSGGKNSPAERFSVSVPKHLGKGPVTRLYNQSLVDAGYYLGPRVSGHLTLGSRLATLAFRKVNKMARNYSYKPVIFRKLLMGRGDFRPRYHAGHHVEVDISRQVMALVDGDNVVATFHVSTGKPSTPTVRGTYHFYSKTPGYNSHGMYYSVYFIRGYATHGYNPVPTHEAASHGCVRNPIPFSVYIYNWIHLGDAIHVYN